MLTIELQTASFYIVWPKEHNRSKGKQENSKFELKTNKPYNCRIELKIAKMIKKRYNIKQ